VRPSARDAALPLLALVAVSLIWGAHAVVGASLERRLAPFSLTVWRFSGAAVLFLPAWPRAWPRIRTLPGREIGLLVFASLLWAVIYPLTYYESLLTLSPVESLFLVNLAPLAAALFALVLFRETLKPAQWAGIFIAVCGTVIIACNGSWAAGGGSFALAFAAMLAFALYTTLSRRLFARLPLFDVLAFTTLTGATFLWIIAGMKGRAPAMIHALSRLGPGSLAEFVFIVAMVSGLAYVFYGYGLARVPAGIASAVTFYPQAVAAIALEWIAFGREPSLRVVLGGAVILAGTCIASPTRKPAAG
jgi:drug/metabolite transporter (DMT)-like permease